MFTGWVRFAPLSSVIAGGSIRWSETFSVTPILFAHAVSWEKTNQYMSMKDPPLCQVEIYEIIMLHKVVHSVSRRSSNSLGDKK